MPIAITTGIGPSRPRTQWIQRPDDYIHPDLLALSNLPSTLTLPATQQALTTSQSFASDHTNIYELAMPSPAAPQPPLALPQPTSSGLASWPPRPSTASCQPVVKPKIIQIIPKKCSLADSILDISKYVVIYTVITKFCI